MLNQVTIRHTQMYFGRNDEAAWILAPQHNASSEPSGSSQVTKLSAVPVHTILEQW